MNLFPPVRSNVRERFIFNFRVPASFIAEHVPVKWLRPQLLNGSGVLSFCLLDLRQITVAPLPTLAGFNSISCAHRFAVESLRDGVPTASVYVPRRYTSSNFGAWFTQQGFAAPHPYIQANIQRQQGVVQIAIRSADRTPLFQATIRPRFTYASTLFPEPHHFVRFMKDGVRSYGDSVRRERLTVIDLHKEDTPFEPMEVLDWYDGLLSPQVGPEVTLDSAFRTEGGRYQWVYHGLVPLAAPQTRAVALR
ncbi:MAG: hypothetical protein MUD01_21345 [Chloroflexaceae bacterium]|jgi:hypothetical protein|nr:hypothetical protein [Chloroflexaceae bacterium]